MSSNPNHTCFILESKRSIHTRATFSEFTIVWLNALDKSRGVKTLQDVCSIRRLSILPLCHQQEYNQESTYSLSVHISYIVPITYTVIKNTRTHI